MRRVLFDHNVPGPLKAYFKAYEVTLADEMGWAKLSNGKLLDAAEDSGFDVLLTGDQTIKYEQSMADRKIGIVSMSDNHWNSVKYFIRTIVEAVESVSPGKIHPVFCGKFVPRKFRTSSESNDL